MAPPLPNVASGGVGTLQHLVEGVTEWLPISSTGHLTVTQDLLGIDGDAANSYAIAIQAGAILAVLGLYRDRFVTMKRGLRGRGPRRCGPPAVSPSTRRRGARRR